MAALYIATSLTVAMATFLSESSLADTNDPGNVLSTLLVADMAVRFGLIISYLVWMWRASRNLKALGVERQLVSPNWAVAWWFVPFANLVMPYKTTQEISEGSKPSPDAPTPRLVIWWLLYIASWLTIPFPIIAAATNSVALLMLIGVIRVITVNQAEKHTLMTAPQSSPAPVIR